MADALSTLHFVASLSYGTRYYRFGRGNFRLDEEQARCLCAPDLSECADFVVMGQRGADESLVGSARYCIDADGRGCEFALVVADAWQGLGIGRALMEALLASARRSGLAHIHGRILASNSRMIAFARQAGFQLGPSAEGAAVIEAGLALRLPVPRPCSEHM